MGCGHTCLPLLSLFLSTSRLQILGTDGLDTFLQRCGLTLDPDLRALLGRCAT